MRQALRDADPALPAVRVRARRADLAKRRWRGVAEDGEEFGFDLEEPLSDGEAVAATGGAVYRIAQEPEPMVRVALGEDPGAAARLGWMLGNLHFPVEVRGGDLLAPDDPAVRAALDRAGIAWEAGEELFKPLRGGHTHGGE